MQIIRSPTTSHNKMLICEVPSSSCPPLIPYSLAKVASLLVIPPAAVSFDSSEVVCENCLVHVRASTEILHVDLRPLSSAKVGLLKGIEIHKKEIWTAHVTFVFCANGVVASVEMRALIRLEDESKANSDLIKKADFFIR